MWGWGGWVGGGGRKGDEKANVCRLKFCAYPSEAYLCSIFANVFLVLFHCQYCRPFFQVLRLLAAFQYHEKHGEVCPEGWKAGKVRAPCVCAVYMVI